MSVRRYIPLFIWPKVTLYYACTKSFDGEKMSDDGKPASGCTRILTDYARKRKRGDVLVNDNIIRINIP